MKNRTNPSHAAKAPASAGQRPAPLSRPNRWLLLLLALATILAAGFRAWREDSADRRGPTGLKAFSLERPTLQGQSAVPDAAAFPEHLRTPWQLYIHPEKRP